MTLPDETRRLFAHVADGDLELPRHEPELIERLLEDGDASDLRWLVAAVPEARLAAWLRERGARRLSARSRAFWSVVLDIPWESAEPGGNELWPL